jgi:hypothetical protein
VVNNEQQWLLLLLMKPWKAQPQGIGVAAEIRTECLKSLPTDTTQSQSYITTDSQSASPSWCQEPIWEPRPIFPIDFFFVQFRVC